MSDEKLEHYYDYLVEWLQEKTKEAKAKGLVIGISGGIDSALVAHLAKKAFPNDSLGILMPIVPNKQDVNDALELCQSIDMDHQIVSLKDTFNNLVTKIKIKNKASFANLQARLRMSTLYAFAQEHNYLVVGTSNAAEYYLGYYTKHGDNACDLWPIINLQKSQIFQLAKLKNIPKAIISKKPSGGLWENQEDEKELGFTYQQLEAYLSGEELSQEITYKIKTQHQTTMHKRNSVPIPLKIKEI